MNIILFILAVLISYIVVRIGAVAFELTGMDWKVAKFQALSCFTSTGFTTKESEQVTQNQQRRKIAVTLMIFGHAGLVTLIATFMNSLRPSELVHKIFQPIIHLDGLPTLSVLVNILILSLVGWLFIILLSHTKISKKFTKLVQNFFLKKNFISKTYIQDLVTSAGGYGVISIEVTKHNLLYHHSFAEIKKDYAQMKILAIERGRNIITNFTDETKILLGDNIISYGKVEEIKRVLHERLIDKVKDRVNYHKKNEVRK